jgi:hypothetical protein
MPTSASTCNRTTHRRDAAYPSTPSSNQELTHIQVVVSLVNPSLRQAALEARLPRRPEVAFLAHPTLAVVLVRPTTPRRTTHSVVPPLLRLAVFSAEELRPRTLASAPATLPTLALGSHSEAPQITPLATPPKAQLLLPSYRLPRKMALVLVPPALTRASQCSHNTRTRALRS